MKRRNFLSSAVRAGLVALLPATKAKTQSSEPEPHSQQVTRALPSTLIGDKAMEGYFTEERMYEALGTRTLNKPTDVKVVAYNFPSWHPSPFMEARFGKGWTEYEALKNARPLFPGHSMPHYPLWGYYDESDPVWAAREIDLAKSSGIDAWLIDWYWHNGTQFYQEQLEQGFLKAENRSKLQFAVMWANHDWKNVYPARSPDQAAILLPQLHSLPDFIKVTNYCAEHYFSQPNYLKIDDGLVFAIFDVGKLVEQLGVDDVKRALASMRERANKMGYPKLHLQVCNGYEKYGSRLRELDFDSATQYGTFGWTYGSKPAGSRLPYGVGAVEGIQSWAKTRNSVDVKFYPCCSVGWDDSPRFEEYACVAINRSPDQFERLVRAARHSVSADTHSKYVYIAAWNEWTEDHVLLPDTYWGYSYLESLRRAIRD